MSSDCFQLSTVLTGHSQDVRGVSAATADIGTGECSEMMLSSSRDGTGRVWRRRDQNSKHFDELATLSGHKGYVYDVVALTSTEGCTIYTCGQDHTIRAYAAPHFQFVYALEGHEGNVCCLFASSSFALVLSGGFDSKVCVWMHADTNVVIQLTGHEAAVWGVCTLPVTSSSERLPPILSASADRTLKLWKAGECVHTFKGHRDAVRAVVPISETQFLSASNDAAVKMWRISGECLRDFCGHDNYIYALALVPGVGFVTGGEDHTVRVWTLDDTKPLCTLTLPTQTVWTVTGLANGDVAAGSSDGMIRVFSAKTERHADPDLLQLYSEEVTAFIAAQQAEKEIGGYKVADLPGPEALQAPGKEDGATKMVRLAGDKVHCYQWSGAEAKWMDVGEVMAAKPPSEGKKMHNGEEYDFVFDVDIEEGKPPIKLPYNRHDDPWFAAQGLIRFINKNALPQVYLDQVAAFIIQNAPGAGTGAVGNTDVVDPYTGSGRYVPGTVANMGDNHLAGSQSYGGDPFTSGSKYVPGLPQSNVDMNGGGAHDPFTGAGRYVPQSAGQAVGGFPTKDSSDWKTPRSDHIPLREPITFTTVSAEKLFSKLESLNSEEQTERLRLDSNQFLGLKLFLAEFSSEGSGGESLGALEFQGLELALQWPEQNLVPVLDLLRLVLCTQNGNQYFFGKEQRANQLFDHLCRLVSTPPSPALLICAARCFANAFAAQSGRIAAQSVAVTVRPILIKALLSDSVKAAAQIALCSALANFAMCLFNDQEDARRNDMLKEFLTVKNEQSNAIDWFVSSMDRNAVIAVLQIVGTLIWGSAGCITIGRSLGLAKVVSKAKDCFNDEIDRHIARTVDKMLIGPVKY